MYSIEMWRFTVCH